MCESRANAVRSQFCPSLPTTLGRALSPSRLSLSLESGSEGARLLGCHAGHLGAFPQRLPTAGVGARAQLPPTLVMQRLWLTHNPPGRVTSSHVPGPACWWGGCSSLWQVPSLPWFTYQGSESLGLVQQVLLSAGRDSWSQPEGQPRWGSVG